jgi:SAM-dependent methyltransferase
MTMRPDAPATGRNKQAILEVLEFEYRDCASVLEIGSGTGQHAVHFAAAMPWLVWQTSDLTAHHESIRAWTEWSGLPNVKPPLAFDAAEPLPLEQQFDAVFSSNTAHIMSVSEVEKMFGHVAQLLLPGGVFCLYGPFNENGSYTSASNAAFDAALKAQKSSMGIRDRGQLDRLARQNGLLALRRYAMPANNQVLVWQQSPRAAPAQSGVAG